MVRVVCFCFVLPEQFELPPRSYVVLCTVSFVTVSLVFLGAACEHGWWNTEVRDPGGVRGEGQSESAGLGGHGGRGNATGMIGASVWEAVELV